MNDVKPLLVDRATAKQMLGNIGDTKLYELLKHGEIEGVYLGSKRLFKASSIEALADRLVNSPPPPLKRRNANMKYVAG